MTKPTNEEIVKALTASPITSSLAKSILGEIPFFGSAINEIIDLLPTKAANRKKEYLLTILNRLQAIEEKVDKEKVSNSELFFDTVMFNGSAFVRTSDEQSRKALVNAVVSVALNTEMEYEETMIFNRHLLDFSGAHLKVLKAFTQLDSILSGEPSIERNLNLATSLPPKLNINNSVYRVVINDLISRYLLFDLPTLGGTSSYINGTYHAIKGQKGTGVPNEDISKFPVTAAGIKFLDYIQL